MSMDVFVAPCNRTRFSTDVDVLAIPYAAADLVGPIKDKPIRLERDALALDPMRASARRFCVW